VRYRVHSMRIRCKRWYPTKEAAIAAFERNCKRLGISPPRYYPPAVCPDISGSETRASLERLQLWVRIEN
jgi:hypothetical protein